MISKCGTSHLLIRAVAMERPAQLVAESAVGHRIQREVKLLAQLGQLIDAGGG